MKRSILSVCLLLVCLSMAAQKRMAVVESSAAFLRSAADYESSLETQLLMGRVVEILDSDSYWKKVRSIDPPYTAWVTEMSLAEKNGEEMEAYLNAPKYICTADHSHIYSAPSEKSGRICDLSAGGIVMKTLKGNGKAAKAGAFLAVTLPSGRQGFVPKRDLADFEEIAGMQTTQEGIVNTAKRFIGVPYMWGGNFSGGFDCSGLSMLVYFMNGISLPRNASQQAKCGIEVPLDELQPGDLLFFGRAATPEKAEGISHVAIYIGGGRIIHASEVVRNNTLTPGQPDSYVREVLHARRIIGYADRAHGLFPVSEMFGEHWRP